MQLRPTLLPIRSHRFDPGTICNPLLSLDNRTIGTSSMDFPDQESMERHLAALLERSRNACINFIFTELNVGLMYCRQLRESHHMREEKRVRLITQADLALKVAELAMWKTKPLHPEFDQMMALVERLKFELGALRE
jgi:hypothetical protein